MDESFVDIVLILLAALVAIVVIPEFNVELPVSTEIDESEIVLVPLQISMSSTGHLTYLDSENEELALPYTELYDLIIANASTRIVEIHADALAPARFLLEVNRIIQKSSRDAIFLIQRENG